MKIGVLSDIHGNLPALERVLVQADAENVERFFILGDMVGYYYWPAECLALLEQRQCDHIRGNHEDMLSEIRNDTAAAERFSKKYGSALAETAVDMNANELDRITSLPRNKRLTIDDHKVLLCHGSPDDTCEYIYPDAAPSQRSKFATGDSSVVFFGHTHYPVVWNLDDRKVANPGSVGQPRNYQAGAHWLLWNTETNEFFPKIETYDIASVTEECKIRDPEVPYLQRVLVRSRASLK